MRILKCVIPVLFILFLTCKVFSATIYVPDNYSTIQYAINNASAGDTIIVRPGVYKEDIKIGKKLHLIGYGAVIDGLNDGIANVAFVTGSDGSVIEGFTIINESGTTPGITCLDDGITIKNMTLYSDGIGIAVYNHKDIYIYNVTIYNCNKGIVLGGLSGSVNVTISKSNIYNNLWRGIEVGNSAYITIHNNTIHDNGISLYFIKTKYCNVIGNEIYNDSSSGIYGNQTSLCRFVFNKIHDNGWTATGSAGINLVYHSINNYIGYNNIYKNYRGIWIFKWCDNNTIEYNYIHDNNWNGIVVDWYSANNIVRYNYVTRNNEYGIRIVSYSYNNIVTYCLSDYNKEYGFICFNCGDNNTIENSVAMYNYRGGIIVKNSTVNSLLFYNITSINNYGNNIYLQNASNIYFLDTKVGGFTQYDINVFGCYNCHYEVNNISIEAPPYFKFKLIKKNRKVANFTVTSNNDVVFVINNLIPNSIYMLYVDGYPKIKFSTYNRTIVFVWSKWSTHNFKLMYLKPAYEYGAFRGKINTNNNNIENSNFYIYLAIVFVLVGVIVLIFLITRY